MTEVSKRNPTIARIHNVVTDINDEVVADLNAAEEYLRLSRTRRALVLPPDALENPILLQRRRELSDNNALMALRVAIDDEGIDTIQRRAVQHEVFIPKTAVFTTDTARTLPVSLPVPEKPAKKTRKRRPRTPKGFKPTEAHIAGQALRILFPEFSAQTIRKTLRDTEQTRGRRAVYYKKREAIAALTTKRKDYVVREPKISPEITLTEEYIAQSVLFIRFPNIPQWKVGDILRRNLIALHGGRRGKFYHEVEAEKLLLAEQKRIEEKRQRDKLKIFTPPHGHTAQAVILTTFSDISPTTLKKILRTIPSVFCGRRGKFYPTAAVEKKVTEYRTQSIR